MDITAIRWWLYRIPLQRDFTTAHDTMAVREGAIVELTTADGLVGYGEIAPLPEFAGGDLRAAIAALTALAPSLKSQQPTTVLHQLYAALASAVLPPTTVCGLESALLAILGQAQQKSVGQLLADEQMMVRAAVPVNAVIGSQAVDTAVARARQAVAQGFHCIKLKVGQDVRADLERVAAVRAAIGPSVHLRLDANEGWNFMQASTFLQACAPYDIQYVEQPLPAADIEGMQRLRKAVRAVPLAVDEAVHDLQSAHAILSAGAADVLVIKPQLAGGLHAGRQIIQLAASCGVQCVVTSTIEAGIGVVGALHLAAASPEVQLECGLATLAMLVNDLLLATPALENGLLSVPTGVGLGVRLDRAALEKYTYVEGGA